jgi:DHA1 family tetracycline resistance protein-like MFS transporter
VPVAVLTVFLDLIGFGIILPLLPLYVDAMGGSAETVGILFGCFAGTQLVATPILGRLSDRVGRRPVILVSLAGNALSMVGFALATKLLLLPMLFVSRIIAGATAGNISACQAAVSDVTSEKERAHAMGKIGAGLNLGLICGPIMASTLSARGAWVPPLAAAGLALTDFVAALFLMPETRHVRASDPQAIAVATIPKPKLRLGALSETATLASLVAYFFIFLTITNMQVALALLAKLRLGWGAQEVGWVFGTYAAIGFIVQGLLIGRLVAIFGEVPLVIAGSICAAAGMLIIGEAHTPLTLLGGVGLFALGLSLTVPSITTLASKTAPPDSRGLVLGALQSSGTFARTVGPLLSGVLFHRVAPRAPFVAGAIAAVLCCACAPALVRRRLGT